MFYYTRMKKVVGCWRYYYCPDSGQRTTEKALLDAEAGGVDLMEIEDGSKEVAAGGGV